MPPDLIKRQRVRERLAPEEAPDVVRHRQGPPPEGRYRYLALTRKYNLWTATGINEHGLAIGQSSGPLKQGGQDGSGINYLLLIRLVLERCRTVEEGVRLLGGLTMAGKGYLFMLVDAEGGIRAVEKWHDRQAVRAPSDGGLFFANPRRRPDATPFGRRAMGRAALPMRGQLKLYV